MKKIITTSWDDGHPLDQRIADLLAKYGLKGTFYAPAVNPEHEVMTVRELKELATCFEIGGHTKNHVVLTDVTSDVASNEILQCKNWLSDILSISPVCFCYPHGKLNKSIVEEVRNQGFMYGRTTELSRTDISNELLAPTTMQVYNHTKLTYAKNCSKRRNLGGVRMLFNVHGYSPRLIDLTEYWLQTLQKEGGIFHLWGHSWEIDKYNLWKELEHMLKIASSLEGFHYYTNGELLLDAQK